jgi:hypothetical protein
MKALCRTFCWAFAWIIKSKGVRGSSYSPDNKRVKTFMNMVQWRFLLRSYNIIVCECWVGTYLLSDYYIIDDTEMGFWQKHVYQKITHIKILFWTQADWKNPFQSPKLQFNKSQHFIHLLVKLHNLSHHNLRSSTDPIFKYY